MRGKMFGRGNLLSQQCHILCKWEILWRGGIFKRFPQVKNAANIKYLCGFGDFAENSKASTNFEDSEDVHEDLISSLGLGHPSTLPISQCLGTYYAAVHALSTATILRLCTHNFGCGKFSNYQGDPRLGWVGPAWNLLGSTRGVAQFACGLM